MNKGLLLVKEILYNNIILTKKRRKIRASNAQMRHRKILKIQKES